MKQWELSLYTNSQLSRFTNLELATYLTYHCVTNRTHADVERWRKLRNKGWSGMSEEERREWLGEITPSPAAWKGMYSYQDMNRVETIVEMLAIRLQALGYIFPELTVKTDWTYSDELTQEDIERYFGNVAILRECISKYVDVPVAPTIQDKLNFKLANDIETILINVDKLSTGQSDSWYHAGEVFSGEV